MLQLSVYVNSVNQSNQSNLEDNRLFYPSCECHLFVFGLTVKKTLSMIFVQILNQLPLEINQNNKLIVSI